MIETNLNTRWNSSINNIPNEVHYKDRADPDVILIREKIKARGKKLLETRGIENTAGEVKVFDRVRLAKNKYKFSKPNKNGKMKTPTEFGKEIYKVIEVGHDYIKVQGKPEKLYSYQFQLIPEKTVTIDQARNEYIENGFYGKEQKIVHSNERHQPVKIENAETLKALYAEAQAQQKTIKRLERSIRKKKQLLASSKH